MFVADIDSAAAPAALDAVRSAAGDDADVQFVQVISSQVADMRKNSAQTL